MNTRTMRREVYEAHEMMRKSQIRKRCINRCQRAFIRKLKTIGIIAILIIAAVAATVKAVSYFSHDDIEEQAKTAAYVAEDIKVEMPELPVLPTSAITTSMVFYDSNPEEQDPGYIIDLNEPEEPQQTVVDEEDPGYIIDINEPDPVETPDPVVVEEPVEFPDVPDDHGYQYTDEDYQYLLMVIVGEAQNCSKKHQMYVGSVVLNRLHSEKYFKYAHCIKDVALAEGQYTCFKDGNAYRAPTDLNIEVAKELIAGGSILPSNVIFQAQFKQGDGVYEQIGNTYFCYKD